VHQIRRRVASPFFPALSVSLHFWLGIIFGLTLSLASSFKSVRALLCGLFLQPTFRLTVCALWAAASSLSPAATATDQLTGSADRCD
jgi:hypothetical protein